MYVILPTYTTFFIQYCQLFRVISRYSWLFMVIHVIKPTAGQTRIIDIVWLWVDYYTRRQINLYRMFFADFSVNSHRFWWNFARTIFESRSDYPEIFIKKYYVVRKLDHLTCNKFEITTSLYKPIKLGKLEFVFSPELHYMPDGLTF